MEEADWNECAILELARVFNDRDSAISLAKQAGFPIAWLPQFRSAALFWRDLAEQADNGRVDGFRSIVDEARKEYPHNVKFVRLLDRSSGKEAESSCENVRLIVKIVVLVPLAIFVVALWASAMAFIWKNPEASVALIIIIAQIFVLVHFRNKDDHSMMCVLQVRVATGFPRPPATDSEQ